MILLHLGQEYADSKLISEFHIIRLLFFTKHRIYNYNS